MKVDIAIAIQVYNLHFWLELENYINFALNTNNTIDIYISLVRNNPHTEQELIDFKERALDKYPKAIIRIYDEICGDSGSFFLQLQDMIDTEKEYEYVIKLHYMTDFYKMKETLASCILTKDTLESRLQLLDKHPEIGIIYRGKFKQSLNQKDKEKLLQYLTYCNQSIKCYDVDTTGIFIARFNPLKKWIQKHSTVTGTHSRLWLDTLKNEPGPGYWKSLLQYCFVPIIEAYGYEIFDV